VTTTPATDKRLPRVDALTGLRWWAAFFVFLYHMLVLAPLPTVSAVLGQGYLGVTFFFVLSGFVLTWSWSARVTTSTFYWRRFARIYPSHIAALILAIPVFYTLSAVPDATWLKPFDAGILALSVVLLQGWFLNPAILFSGNPAAWTLTCEAFFYALHPFFSRILTPLIRRGALVFALITVVVAFLYRALALAFPDAWFSAAPQPLVHLPEFVLGMGLAWAFRQGWRPRLPIFVGLAAIAAVVIAIVLLPGFMPGSLPAFLITGFGTELFAVACALAIIAAAQRTVAGKHSAFASPLQVRLGEWSYAFYLVHASFVYIALRIFGVQPVSWWNLLWFAALLCIALAAAAALHHLVEKPFERRMRAWKDAREAS